MGMYPEDCIRRVERKGEELGIIAGIYVGYNGFQWQVCSP